MSKVYVVLILLIMGGTNCLAQAPELIQAYNKAIDDEERLFLAAIIIDQMRLGRESKIALQWTDTLRKYAQPDNDPAWGYHHFIKMSIYAQFGVHKEVFSYFRKIEQLEDWGGLEYWRRIQALMLGGARYAFLLDEERGLFYLDQALNLALQDEDTVSTLRVKSQIVLTGFALNNTVLRDEALLEYKKAIQDYTPDKRVNITKLEFLSFFQDQLWVISLFIVLFYFYQMAEYFQTRRAILMEFMGLLLVIQVYLWLGFSFFGPSAFNIFFLGYDTHGLMMYSLLGILLWLFTRLQQNAMVIPSNESWLRHYSNYALGLYAISVGLAWAQVHLFWQSPLIQPMVLIMVLMVVQILAIHLKSDTYEQGFWLRTGNYLFMVLGLVSFLSMNRLNVSDIPAIGFVVLLLFSGVLLSYGRAVRLKV